MIVNLFGRKEIHADLFCPACAWVAREGGLVIIARHKRLCSFHLGRLTALLDAKYADTDQILYWSQFLRSPGTKEFY